MKRVYQFPYEEIKKGERVVLYGGGQVGRSFVEQIKLNSYCKIVAIADQNFENIGEINHIKVIAPDEISKYDYDKIIVSVKNEKDEICKFLHIGGGMKKDCIVSKDFQELEIDPPEVLTIRTVFDAIGIKTPSYIDAGVCHPHILSNTMAFYRAGSRGINIDANAELKEELDMYRPEDTNLFVGLAKEPGELTFYKANAPALNTFSQESIKWHSVVSKATFNAIGKIKVTTLNNIVDEYANGEFPDFLDIDIEGMDAEVLKSADFSKSSPKLIICELPPDIANEILRDKNCEGGGYEPYCRLYCNTIYLRKDVYKKVLSL